MIPAVTEPPRRIADRDDPIADFGAIAVSPCDVGEPLARIDLEEGDVGFLVSADHPGSVPAVVLKNHGDLVGVGDDMVVCYYSPAGSVMNPEPSGDLFRGIAELGLFENAFEELVERRAARPQRGGALIARVTLALGGRLLLNSTEMLTTAGITVRQAARGSATRY